MEKANELEAEYIRVTKPGEEKWSGASGKKRNDSFDCAQLIA